MSFSRARLNICSGSGLLRPQTCDRVSVWGRTAEDHCFPWKNLHLKTACSTKTLTAGFAVFLISEHPRYVLIEFVRAGIIWGLWDVKSKFMLPRTASIWAPIFSPWQISFIKSMPIQPLAVPVCSVPMGIPMTIPGLPWYWDKFKMGWFSMYRSLCSHCSTLMFETKNKKSTVGPEYGSIYPKISFKSKRN